MSLRARLGSRYPDWLAIAHGHAAIRVDGELDLHEGASLGDAQRMTKIEPVALPCEIPAPNWNTMGLQPCQSAPRHAGIRVGRAVDRKGDARIHDGMCAGRRGSKMAAGLKRREDQAA